MKFETIPDEIKISGKMAWHARKAFITTIRYLEKLQYDDKDKTRFAETIKQYQIYVKELDAIFEASE